MGFSVGDRVRVRDDLEVNYGYGYLVKDLVTPSMLYYCGKEARILSRTVSGLFTLDIDCRFHLWTEEMLMASTEPEVKPLLHTGVFGILNTGDKFVVVNDTLVFQDGHFALLSQYDNPEMKNGSLWVESLYNARAFDAMTENNQTWAREVVRELTQAELEDLLGFKVKLVES